MRPLWMPRDLRLLPRRQLAIEFLERLGGLAFELADLLGDRHGIVGRRHCAQFLDLGLKLGHRFFEIEIAAHEIRRYFAEKSGKPASRSRWAN